MIALFCGVFLAFSAQAEELSSDGGSAVIKVLPAADVTDTDEDYLIDVVEIELGLDPFHWDTDRDGIDDHYEVTQAFDPFADDAYEDYNCDRVPNIEHYINHTDPWWHNPLDQNDDFCVDIIDLIFAIRESKDAVTIQRIINHILSR